MAIRIKHSVLVQISRDTDAKKKLFYPDANDVILDGFDAQSSGNLSVPATTIETIPFGDITDVRGLFVEVSGDVVVRLNGGTDNIPITLAPGATKAQFFLEGNLSASVVENEGATTITGIYCVWGDPTP